MPRDPYPFGTGCQGIGLRKDLSPLCHWPLTCMPGRTYPGPLSIISARCANSVYPTCCCSVTGAIQASTSPQPEPSRPSSTATDSNSGTPESSSKPVPENEKECKKPCCCCCDSANARNKTCVTLNLDGRNNSHTDSNYPPPSCPLSYKPNSDVRRHEQKFQCSSSESSSSISDSFSDSDSSSTDSGEYVYRYKIRDNHNNKHKQPRHSDRHNHSKHNHQHSGKARTHRSELHSSQKKKVRFEFPKAGISPHQHSYHKSSRVPEPPLTSWHYKSRPGIEHSQRDIRYHRHTSSKPSSPRLHRHKTTFKSGHRTGSSSDSSSTLESIDVDEPRPSAHPCTPQDTNSPQHNMRHIPRYPPSITNSALGAHHLHPTLGSQAHWNEPNPFNNKSNKPPFTSSLIGTLGPKTKGRINAGSTIAHEAGSGVGVGLEFYPFKLSNIKHRSFGVPANSSNGFHPAWAGRGVHGQPDTLWDMSR